MGHKNLLKAVLIKSTATMAVESRLQSETQAMFVRGLADEYCRTNHDFDVNQMNIFLATLKEIGGDVSGAISVHFSNNADVRFHLERAIPLLMQVLKIERSAAFARLSVINWRLLFSIEPEPPVQIAVVPGSDDDSGGASGGSTNPSTNCN